VDLLWKRFGLLTVIFMIAAFSLFPGFAVAQFPFGGPITWYFPACEVPPATWIILGPPTFSSLMYMGALSYSYGPPSHWGQQLLGMSTAWMPCIILVPCPPSPAPCPVIIGGGMLILFHGSSH